MTMTAVFLVTQILKAFSSGDLNVPPIRHTPRTGTCIPQYFVGDEAFPLKPRT